MKEYIEHLIVRTPVEDLPNNIRWFFKFKHHPDLNEIYIEKERIKQIMNLVISKYSNCLDIGCHFGLVLSTIIKLAPQGCHVAFEALPYKVNWLKKKFPEVDIRQVALGEKTGEVTFYQNTTHSGYSGILPQKKKGDKIKEVTVKCEKLDNILSPEYQVDFIKIDVVGSELAVLRGAKNILQNYRPKILFQCIRSSFPNFGFNSAMIYEFFTKENNYSIFLIKDFLENGESLRFEQFDSALNYPFKAFNFIASAR